MTKFTALPGKTYIEMDQEAFVFWAGQYRHNLQAIKTPSSCRRGILHLVLVTMGICMHNTILEPQ